MLPTNIEFPICKKLTRSSAMKSTNRRAPVSSNGSTTSSHATISEESVDDGRKVSRKRPLQSCSSYAVGTLVKKVCVYK